jgi:hypothetical protein
LLLLLLLLLLLDAGRATGLVLLGPRPRGGGRGRFWEPIRARFVAGRLGRRGGVHRGEV